MAVDVFPFVHLERGVLPEYPGHDLGAVLRELGRRFGRVGLADVSGVRRNDADLESIQAHARAAPLWVDAGSRFATDVMDLFIAGADRVTVRWNTLRSAEELEEAASLAQPGGLFLGLEFPGGKFLAHPKDDRSAEDVVALAATHGVGVVVYADSADPAVLRALPAVSGERFLAVSGAPVMQDDVQAFGFAGVLVPPTLLPEEASS